MVAHQAGGGNAQKEAVQHGRVEHVVQVGLVATARVLGALQLVGVLHVQGLHHQEGGQGDHVQVLALGAASGDDEEDQHREQNEVNDHPLGLVLDVVVEKVLTLVALFPGEKGAEKDQDDNHQIGTADDLFVMHRFIIWEEWTKKIFFFYIFEIFDSMLKRLRWVPSKKFVFPILTHSHDEHFHSTIVR